jgi:hypothetical protein
MMSKDELLSTLYNRHAAALSVVALDGNQRVHIDAARMALALLARELADKLPDIHQANGGNGEKVIEAAGADVPADDVAQTSRTLREPSRTLREQFAPNTNIREENNGGGGVQTYTLHHPGFGNGGGCKGGTATAITAALADLVDDDLRIAADQIGSLHGLHDEFNGWPRFLSGATRQELLLVLAWCARRIGWRRCIGITPSPGRTC